jgi:hypothetical protein
MDGQNGHSFLQREGGWHENCESVAVSHDGSYGKVQRVESDSQTQGDLLMAQDTHIYEEVNSKTGLKRIFMEIRHDVKEAKSRPELTELYKRAGYLITLTHAPAW